MRKLGLLKKPKKRPKPRVIKARFSMDTYRRIWARHIFEPASGWPVQPTAMQFDVFRHADVPPQGRKYGIRTHKVCCCLSAFVLCDDDDDDDVVT